MDKILPIKIMIEEYIGKSEKLYAAFMDQGKAYYRVDG